MSNFGQTLFEGSAFVRWALSPFVLIFAVLMPLLITEWTLDRALLMLGMELMCFCLLAGFWMPPRIGFLAFRILAGMVAISYAVYLVHEFFFTDKTLAVPGRRSDASPFNALLGFLTIGVPSLLFAVLGRFSLQPSPKPAQNCRSIGLDDDNT